MSETKEFSKMSNGGLLVTIKNGDKLSLPDKNRTVIGTFESTVKQIIEPKKVKEYHDFVELQLKEAKEQLKKILVDYETVKDTDDTMPESLVVALTNSLKKGSKAFKQKALELNKYLYKLDRKKTLKTQKEYLENQIEIIKSDSEQILRNL